MAVATYKCVLFREQAGEWQQLEIEGNVSVSCASIMVRAAAGGGNRLLADFPLSSIALLTLINDTLLRMTLTSHKRFAIKIAASDTGKLCQELRNNNYPKIDVQQAGRDQQHKHNSQHFPSRDSSALCETVVKLLFRKDFVDLVQAVDEIMQGMDDTLG